MDRFIFYLCGLLPSSGSQIGKTGDKVYMRKNGNQHKMKQNIMSPYYMNVKVMIFLNLKSIVLPKIIQALLSFILAIFPLSILFETGEAALDR